MASDPERPIEKLLRDCARKRREEAGAPFQMHPATRRVLQSEVARQFGKKAAVSPEALGARVARWFPRLAWAFAGAAALVLVLVAVSPSRHKQQMLLARNEPELKQKLAPPSSTPAVIPAQEPAQRDSLMANSPVPERLSQADKDRAKAGEEEQKTAGRSLAPTRPDNLAERQLDLDSVAAKKELSKQPAMAREEPAITPGTAGGTQRLDDASGSVRLLAEAQRFGRSLAGGPQRSAAPAPSLGVPVRVEPTPPSWPAGQLSFKPDGTETNRPYALAEGLRSQSAPEWVQRYVRSEADASTRRAAAADAPSTPLLTAFQVEQSGASVRIIDHDGSVYTGSLLPTDSLLRQQAAAPPATSTILAGAKLATGEARAPDTVTRGRANVYFFRVAGTNLSLHQQVVFSGNVLAGTNGIGGGGGVPSAAAPSAGSPLGNSRISGTALIGDNPSGIQINAVAAKPK